MVTPDVVTSAHPPLRRCHCGESLDLDVCRYVGPQDLGGGEWALLFNCPGCSTTFAGQVVQDAAQCIGCGHLVLGSEDDTKVVLPDGVLCLDCAAIDDRIPRATYGRPRRRRVA